MENHLDAIISKNLMKIRVERNYTQLQIANVLRIKQPSYNRIECGRTRVSATHLWVLAAFYDVSLLMFYVENEGDPEDEAVMEEQAEEPLDDTKEPTDHPDDDHLFYYSSMLTKLRELEEKMTSRDEIIESLLNERLRKVN